MIKAGLKELQLELFLRMREKSQIVWETRDKKLIPINEMSDTHLINTIKMLKRQQQREQEKEDYYWTVLHDLEGLTMEDIC